MKNDQFYNFSEILERLHKVQTLFYNNSSTSEAHFMFGKLVEYVENINHETDEDEN